MGGGEARKLGGARNQTDLPAAGYERREGREQRRQEESRVLPEGSPEARNSGWRYGAMRYLTSDMVEMLMGINAVDQNVQV